MGLLIFSLVVSVIISGIFWLIAGDLLPLGAEVKWDSRKNMACYIAVNFAASYLLIFSLF